MSENRFGLAFHHLGLATRKWSKAVEFLDAMGYRCGRQIWDPQHLVNLSMCVHVLMPDVELIGPEGDTKGPIDGLLTRLPGGAIYHLCYTTASLVDSLGELGLAALDLTEVVAPTPAVLFGGDPVSFYMVDGLGLIEIIEGTGVAIA